MDKKNSSIKSNWFLLILSISFILTICLEDISWALDIKQMTENTFREYIDGSGDLKWGADELVGPGKKIAKIPYESKHEDDLWTTSYNTKDGRTLYFHIGEFFAFYVSAIEVETELKKIEEKFGEGKPSKVANKEWILNDVTIRYWKYQDGSSNIMCLNNKMSKKYAKYKPTKEFLFTVFKEKIMEEYGHQELPLDTFNSKILIYGEFVNIYKLIAYVLRNSYGFEKIQEVVTNCRINNRLKGTEAEQVCIAVETICNINKSNLELYRDIKYDVSYYHSKIEDSVKYLNGLGTSGQKVIEFIDEYNKLIEKSYKEKKEAEKIAIAKKNKQSEDHAKLVKTGKTPIRNLEDAKIFYNAKKDISIVTKPPITPDQKYYNVWGVLDGKDGIYYRVRYDAYNDLHYFMFHPIKNIKPPNLRIGQSVEIVGKFTKLFPYTTVSGTERYMCIFEAVGIK